MNRLNLQRRYFGKKFEIIVKINILSSNTKYVIESVRFEIQILEILRNSIGMIYFQKFEIIPKELCTFSYFLSLLKKFLL